ncbi:MAG: alpha/beta hydrolase [Pseudodonghicola sp.]
MLAILKRAALASAGAVAFLALGVAAQADILTAPGPEGPLQGVATLVPGAAAAAVIIPGSGPTDRDGNSPPQIRTDSYKLLAEALARRGISALRVDKRGMFGSAAALRRPEEVTIADYAGDAREWAATLACETGLDCVWLAGHSEGGLVALAAISDALPPSTVCGAILLATPGRPVGALMRDQLRANPANAPFLPEFEGMIDVLEQGAMVDPETLSPALRPLFGAGLQRYMIDLFSYDPATLAADVRLPVLIVQGDRDMQVTLADADLLADARLGVRPDTRLVKVAGMTHMLKADQPGAPFATYSDPALPLMTEVPEAIAAFVLPPAGGRSE